MKNSEWNRPASLLAFGRALRGARARAGMTLDQLAQATGISKPYLSNIETARAPGPPSEEKLRSICQALKLPVEEVLVGADWLRTPASVRRALVESERREEGDTPRRGDGSIDLDLLMRGGGKERGNDERQRGKDERRKTKDESGGRDELRGGDAGGVGAGGTGGVGEMPLRHVPVINRVAAGGAKEFTDMSYPAGVADGYVPAPDLPGASLAGAFAVRVSGDSMMPEYREGEILIVGPGEAKDGDDCVVRLGEMEGFATTFKRVFFERGVKDERQKTKDEMGGEEVVAVRLVPLNPAHAERRVKVEEVTGIYPLMYRLIPGRGNHARAGKKASERLT